MRALPAHSCVFGNGPGPLFWVWGLLSSGSAFIRRGALQKGGGLRPAPARAPLAPHPAGLAPPCGCRPCAAAACRGRSPQGFRLACCAPTVVGALRALGGWELFGDPTARSGPCVCVWRRSWLRPRPACRRWTRPAAASGLRRWATCALRATACRPAWRTPGAARRSGTLRPWASGFAASRLAAAGWICCSRRRCVMRQPSSRPSHRRCGRPGWPSRRQ